MNKLNKSIFAILFFSMFGTVTGVGIVVPLLPIYAHDLGASGLYIGLIFGAFSISRTFLLPYFGRQSDKKGRKPFIVAGLFAYTVVSLAFILSNSVESLIALRFLQGIASAMIMPAVQAYVGDITPAGREGFTMGLFNMSMFLGLSIGPLIGGIISDRFSLDTSFASMGFLTFLCFMLSFFLLPPTKSERVVSRGIKPLPLKWVLRDKEMAGLFFFRLAYAACIGVIWSFLPILADLEFSLSSSSIGILVTIGVFSSGLLHLPMGFMADRVNRNMMVVAGGLIITYAIFSFDWADSFGDLLSASVLFGLGGGIAMPALMALAVLKGGETNAMGSVMSLLAMAHSLGMLAGSLLAGLMMDVSRLRNAFPTGAVMMMLCLGLFMYLTRHKKVVFVQADQGTGPLDLEG
ncbi:MAG: MFS transporter [Deltaproteobacteria bacterium]|nr:MFS transporter [Deltaproteobacteria bacterium]MBW2571044.1 MFS transporter [Deltaproteobacteria bacterium]MBW2669474.1 MFS transporter [Deltaproteobacteria bacterium]